MMTGAAVTQIVHMTMIVFVTLPRRVPQTVPALSVAGIRFVTPSGAEIVDIARLVLVTSALMPTLTIATAVVLPAELVVPVRSMFVLKTEHPTNVKYQTIAVPVRGIIKDAEKADVLLYKDCKDMNVVQVNVLIMAILAVLMTLLVVLVALGLIMFVEGGLAQVPRCTRREVVVHPVVAQRDGV